jgi:hypothetical protein
LLLTILEDLILHKNSLRAFILDFGIHGRFLLAAPMFILAEYSCHPALGRITSYFTESGLVDGEDKKRFDAALRSTLRLLNSTLAEVLTVVLAYGSAVLLRLSLDVPIGAMSAAEFWQMWVSLPLLFILFFGWLWRQILWCRLMWRVGRLDLKLVAAHPDGAGGLRFLGMALWGYCPLGFSMATIVAGGVANRLRDGATLNDVRFFVAGVVIFVLLFFVAPFGVFMPALRRLRRRGILEYGALSSALGHQFEAKWTAGGCENITAEALEAPDFSATTDLYQVASNVYRIRYFPLHTRAVVELVACTLLPFIPLILASVPLQAIFEALKKILL